MGMITAMALLTACADGSGTPSPSVPYPTPTVTAESFSPAPMPVPTPTPDPAFIDDAALREAEGCFRYFWECANTDETSATYGLVRDRVSNINVSSIAATGFALASLGIGAENGWVSEEEAETRAVGTLRTLIGLEQYHGFYYHFMDMNTGTREWNCEVSSVDTALLIAGALTAGARFGGETETLAGELYARIDFTALYNRERDMFYMAYSPEGGYAGAWDVYAEQLILYVLSAGAPNPDYRVGSEAYRGFERLYGSYADGDVFIHSWFGSIFTHQYSHAFVDFGAVLDPDGVDWFENSVVASRSAAAFCRDNADAYSTFKTGWGLSACDSPSGYDGLLGAPPSGRGGHRENKVTGTLPPFGALGSMVFTPELSREALYNYALRPELWGIYGLYSAFNDDQNWVSNDYVGIDKGVTLLMLQNYWNGSVWSDFMSTAAARDGLERLGFTARL